MDIRGALESSSMWGKNVTNILKTIFTDCFCIFGNLETDFNEYYGTNEGI